MKIASAFLFASLLLVIPYPGKAQSNAGQALRCQGVSDYVSVPDNANLQPNTGNFTFECWIKRTGGLNAQAGVIGKGEGLDLIEWQVQIFASGQWQFCYGNKLFAGLSPILDTLWHHLAVTVDRVVDNVTLHAYLDGVLDDVESGTFTGTITDSDSLFIGGNRRHDAAFIGYIDEVRLWNVSRTQAQIQALKNTTLNGNEAGLVAYWRFDGNANDLTNNGNNGILNGNAILAESDAPINTRFEYVADSNTVGLWHMNELTGSSVLDASTYRNNGTANGTAIVDGRFGKARSLPGSGNFIVVSDSPSLRQSQITVEAWVYSAQYDAMPWGIIASKEFTSSSFSYRLQMAGSTSQVYFATGIDQNSGISSTVKLDNGRWYHVAGTFDGTNLRVYVNGVLAGSKVQPGTISYNSDVLYLGRDIDNVGIWNGLLDEVRLSKKARVPAEFNLQLPPINLLGTLSGQASSLVWQNGGGASGLLRYRVYRGSDSTAVVLIDSSLSASYLDAGVSPSTTYFYRVGAVDSSGYEGALSFAARVDIPLPIQLASFNATQSGNNIVRLEWNTLSETNNYGYYIQRRASADKVFSEVSNSFVAGHGTTVIAHHYSYLDTVRTPGPWWYQLKQVDLDGAIHISEPIQSGSETGMQGVVPTSFEVLQNYPNPFNPSTLIRYGLPTKSHVTLTIYNNLGQQVASLVNEERDAGYHEATFDGSELASGVYFYRIVAGSFVQTKKLLLLR